MKEIRRHIGYSQYNGNPVYVTDRKCANPLCVEGKLMPCSK